MLGAALDVQEHAAPGEIGRSKEEQRLILMEIEDKLYDLVAKA